MKHGRKISGGKYHQARKKKLYEKKNQERKVILGKEKRKNIRTVGGIIKSVLISTDVANLIIKGKAKKTKIKKILETPSNKFLAKQNILIKGAIIETDLGKAKITNRPSQEGSVNATLIVE